jgi:hypothetical protein
MSFSFPINILLVPGCKLKSRFEIFTLKVISLKIKIIYSIFKRYNEWCNFVHGSNIVIVELGCGKKVQTGRRESLKMSNYFDNSPIIRINIDSSDFDDEAALLDGATRETIGIRLGCCDALKRIDQVYEKMS